MEFYKKNKLDQYRQARSLYPIVDLTSSEDSDEKSLICKCKSRPKECVCFKNACISHSRDGTTKRCWSTPPPSPILKRYDTIKQWGIMNDDRVYIIRASDGKRITSKMKITDYAYPHCHEKECLKIHVDEYYKMVEEQFGKQLPEPYAEEMTPAETV